MVQATFEKQGMYTVPIFVLLVFPFIPFLVILCEFVAKSGFGGVGTYNWCGLAAYNFKEMYYLWKLVR